MAVVADDAIPGGRAQPRGLPAAEAQSLETFAHLRGVIEHGVRACAGRRGRPDAGLGHRVGVEAGGASVTATPGRMVNTPVASSK